MEKLVGMEERLGEKDYRTGVLDKLPPHRDALVSPNIVFQGSRGFK